MRIKFPTLAEALAFVDAGGGAVEQLDEYARIPGYVVNYGGAYGASHSAVRLADGAYFIVEAYNNGPLSEVTPDEDFGVRMIGIVP